MVDQGYCEVWVTSMFKVTCQDLGPGLNLGLGFWEAVQKSIVTFRLRVLLLH